MGTLGCRSQTPVVQIPIVGTFGSENIGGRRKNMVRVNFSYLPFLAFLSTLMKKMVPRLELFEIEIFFPDAPQQEQCWTLDCFYSVDVNIIRISVQE